MAYCRWSSDNFSCDLYIYESHDGISINVASRRMVGDVPEIDWSSPENLHDSYRQQMKFMEIAHHEPIGLPYDGQSFYGLSREDAIIFLEVLKEIGYNFPSSVIEDLKQEIKEFKENGALD